VKITNTAVRFQTSDSLLQKLVATAETKSLQNLKNFAGRSVLIEGGGYEKIWLETQPMGGEMYAKRNMEAALNNQLLFMETAREDGRIPGSIAMIDGKITPQFNKFQGFCFPAPFSASAEERQPYSRPFVLPKQRALSAVFPGQSGAAGGKSSFAVCFAQK